MSEAVARVASLTVFPIKGCAGMAVDRREVTTTGLAGDRQFMVVAPDGRFKTQRRHPLLATIRPHLDGSTLTLAAEGRAPCTVEVADDGPRRRVEIFGKEHPALDQGDEAAAWLSDVLGVESRLVGVTPEHRRPTDGLVPGLSGWADSGSLLLLSRAAADDLSDRAAERSGEPVPLERFRANVVLTGCPAHAEDHLDRVLLGSARLAFSKQAVRCAVVTVDQQTGARVGPEPLETLATYRLEDQGVVFGAKYTVLEPGEVAVGDELQVE
ncbi:MOSC domain-containing protein [Actinomycetospora straminea]|uniref:MOSC N-terminal beta barrel domain-containing protein n=1 Tax=Actinomycetospora straminea TaxID=663607 RepID=A0ABP9EX59_9PSEU|nr:MOSC N-terminal beta barrel domain-containing protein [Actinomycetospora straminea]MDD7933959.1 MOSC N-terminal beta barrel domain-containing protein [Actinomycetospora straminea]